MTFGKNKRKVFVILPTLNEEEGIGGVISGIKGLGSVVDGIIVVDGHSTDDTVRIARKNGCQVMLQDGKGKGAGFKTFLKKGKIRDDDYYVMLDADLSYDPADIPAVIAGLEDAEIVSGYRRARLEDIDLLHFVGNKLIAFAGLVLFGKWTDMCTGYWGFRGSALKRLDIRADGFDLEANIFASMCEKGISHKDVPVRHGKRAGKRKLKNTDAIIIVKRLFSERFSRGHDT